MAGTIKSRFMIAALLLWIGSGVQSADADAPSPEDSACREFLDARAFSTEPRFVAVSKSLGCQDGTIEVEDGKALLDWAQQPAEIGQQKRLWVRSTGGDAAVALEIAEQLQEKEASVHVVDICASSCANYLYAGLPNRSLADGALVLFHGGFSDQTRARAVTSLDRLLREVGDIIPDHEAERNRVLGQFDRNRRDQDILLNKAGASLAVIYGVEALDKESLSDDLCGGASGPRDFIFFDQKQAEELGIAPSLGQMVSDPSRVNAKIKSLKDSAFVACHAPDSF